MAVEENEPRVASTLPDVSWFEAALAASNANTADTPDAFKPAWFREYEDINESS